MLAPKDLLSRSPKAGDVSRPESSNLVPSSDEGAGFSAFEGTASPSASPPPIVPSGASLTPTSRKRRATQRSENAESVRVGPPRVVRDDSAPSEGGGYVPRHGARAAVKRAGKTAASEAVATGIEVGLDTILPGAGTAFGAAREVRDARRDDEQENRPSRDEGNVPSDPRSPRREEKDDPHDTEESPKRPPRASGGLTLPEPIEEAKPRKGTRSASRSRAGKKGVATLVAGKAKEEAKDKALSTAAKGMGDKVGADLVKDAAGDAKSLLSGKDGGRVKAAGNLAVTGTRAAVRTYVPGGIVVDTVLDRIGYKRVGKWAIWATLASMAMSAFAILIVVLVIFASVSVIAEAANPMNMAKDAACGMSSWIAEKVGIECKDGAPKDKGKDGALMCATVPTLANTPAPAAIPSGSAAPSAPATTTAASGGRPEIGGAAGAAVQREAKRIPKGTDAFTAQAWLFAASADARVSGEGFDKFKSELSRITPVEPSLSQAPSTSSSPATTATSSPSSTRSAPWTTPTLIRPTANPSATGLAKRGWSPLDAANAMVADKAKNWTPYLYPVYAVTYILVQAEEVDGSDSEQMSALTANLAAACQPK